MASILNVDQINNAAGTSGIALDASTGKASFPNSVTIPNGATMPAGSVVQVVQSQGSIGRKTYTATSFTDIITASITPSSTSSKILVTVHTSLTRTSGAYIGSSIFRGSSAIHAIDTQSGYLANSTNEHSIGTIGGAILDAPSTASAVTYSLKMSINGGGGSFLIDGQPVITLMEIAQ